MEATVANDDYQKLLVRLPKEVKAWLKEQASIHSSSETSEIIRAVRERMERIDQRSAA
jgi:hypothetical protein